MGSIRMGLDTSWNKRRKKKEKQKEAKKSDPGSAQN
jgi:hypothetical protein